MSLLLIALCCIFLSETVLASQCANEPWIGIGSEIIATKYDDVTCGDKLDSYDCPRFIEAKSNSDSGYSQVRLVGQYNLLGSVSCDPTPGHGNCTIVTTGDVTVGCCGSYQAYETFFGGDLSTLTIGCNANVDLAKLELESYASFEVGDNTAISDVYQTSSIVVREYSQLIINSNPIQSQFLLSHSVVELKDYSNLQLESPVITLFTNCSLVVESSVVFISTHRGASFDKLAINSIGSIFSIDDVMIFQWFSVNFNLFNSYISWVGKRSSVNLTSTDVSMKSNSKWTIASSTVSLANVTVQFDNDSTMLLKKCILTASNQGTSYNITIGQNSSLIISSNTTSRLRCNLLADLIIPPNVRYTEEDVSGMISCNLTAIYDKEVQLDGTENLSMTNHLETEDPIRLVAASTHYNSCPIGMTTATTTSKQTTATSNTEVSTATTTTKVYSDASTVTTTLVPSTRTISTESQFVTATTTAPPTISIETTAPATITTVITLPSTTSTTTTAHPTFPTATKVPPSINTITAAPATITSVNTVPSSTPTTTNVIPTNSTSTTSTSNTTNNSAEPASGTTTAVVLSTRSTTSAGVTISTNGRLTILIVFATLILILQTD